MNGNNWKGGNARFIGEYSVLFLISAFIVYLPYMVSGKSLIWRTDGLYQHFNAFIYAGEWYRGILKSALVDHAPKVELWDFSIGYGSDVITSLAHYMLFDPFTIFSVIVPSTYAESTYTVSILGRMYSAGLGLGYFCKKLGLEKDGCLCGALGYAFCSYAMFFSGSHTYFITAMVWLPLLLLGVERIAKDDDPVPYTLITCMALISNFYFYYMLIAIVILFVVLRGWEITGGNLVKLFRFGVRAACYTAIGALMGAAVFVPVASAFFGSGREGSNQLLIAPFYSFRQIEKYLLSTITFEQSGYTTFPGVAPIVIIGACAGLTSRDALPWAKKMLVILASLLLTPHAGYALNGFSYISNRWSFMLPFIGNILFATGVPAIKNATAYKRPLYHLLLLANSVLIFLAYVDVGSQWARSFKASYCILLGSSLAVLAFQIAKNRPRFILPNSRVAGLGLLVVLLLVGESTISFYGCSEEKGGFVSGHIDAGGGLAALSSGWAECFQHTDRSEFSRVDVGRIKAAGKNLPLDLGQSSSVQYWSMLPERESEFFDLTSAYDSLTYMNRGQLSRTMLAPLPSARYFVSSADTDYQVPYGFRLVHKTARGFNLYETDAYLPIGYCYSSLMAESQFKELSIPERQQAMLQCAIVPDSSVGALGSIRGVAPSYNDVELSYEMESSDGVEVSGHTMSVKKNGARVKFRIACPENVELYAYFTGMKFGSNQSSAFGSISARSSQALSATYAIYPEGHQYYHGRTNYLMNLYYSDQARDEVELVFYGKGDYTYDDFRLIAQPMRTFDNEVDALKKSSMENVVMTANEVVGSIHAETDSILCLSIPYSKGWRLYIDGVEQELFPVNIMYMGASIKSGSHNVRLVYRTPFLDAGIILSWMGFTIFLVLAVRRVIGKRKEDDPDAVGSDSRVQRRADGPSSRGRHFRHPCEK